MDNTIGIRWQPGLASLPQSQQSRPLEGFLSLVAEGVGQVQGGEKVEPATLEEQLKAKYPGLAYHVFDGSSHYWRTRNDYPHHLLYQQDTDPSVLENWRPTGANPFYGSIDGKFIAPKEIHALGNVPPGSKAVVIHPKVQERMEREPGYAQEIMERIDTWFAFDVARNEASYPGSTVGMCQSVAIGEDGSIVNAQSSSSGGGEITYSSDEMVRADYLRLAKQADFLRMVAKEQREEQLLLRAASQHLAVSPAKAQLAAMLSGQNLSEIFGPTLAGVPTETILSMAQREAWGMAR